MITLVRIPITVTDRELSELGIDDDVESFAYVNIDHITMIREDMNDSKVQSALHLVNGEIFPVPMELKELMKILTQVHFL